MKTLKVLSLLCFFFSQITMAQNHVLYLGGVAHLGNGNKIENAAIATKNGKFVLVIDASLIRIDPTAFDTIIKLEGKHIYPGFILPNTTLGITEIDQVGATHDFAEIGDFNPNVRSLVAYNTDSKIIKTLRSNGVLIAQVTPRGGVISGQSSIMYLDGNNWEDALLKQDDGIHLNWPNSFVNYGWWAQQEEDKKEEKYKEKLAEIDAFFTKAKAYAKSSSKIDLRMENMKGLFSGSKTLYIHTNDAKDIRKAIEMTEKMQIEKVVFVGGEKVEAVANLLQEKNIPVILNRVHRLPNNQDAAIDQPFTQPKTLYELGMLFCLSYEGDMEAMGGRNIGFTAGTTVAYGLEYEQAVASITLNTAKILGIDNLLGSIEEGKNATFFISTGDALDMRTNNIEKAFINGVPIDLNNHQKVLFEQYR